MKTASVSELKANLSRYLRMVRRGSEIQVLKRGIPIARLVGLARGSLETDEMRLGRLELAGILRRGASDVGWLAGEDPIEAPGVALSAVLAADREDRF